MTLRSDKEKSGPPRDDVSIDVDDAVDDELFMVTCRVDKEKSGRENDGVISPDDDGVDMKDGDVTADKE